MGIADAGMDITLPSAAPATILIARAFTGHLPIVAARPETKPANPELARMVSRTPAGGRSRSVEGRHTATPQRTRTRWVQQPHKRSCVCITTATSLPSVVVTRVCHTIVRDPPSTPLLSPTHPLPTHLAPLT